MTEQALTLPQIPSVGKCSATSSGTQALTNGSDTVINLDTDTLDPDGMHFTSVANLTGTVAKTASSAAIVGTGTAFTTELSVGQVISIPGTAAEKRVVTVITDDTHLTVNSVLANSASGQTATRVNSAIVFKRAMNAVVTAGVYYSNPTTGGAYTKIKKNGTSISATSDANDAQGNKRQNVTAPVQAYAQWDYVEVTANINVAGVSSGLTDGLPFLSVVEVL